MKTPRRRQTSAYVKQSINSSRTIRAFSGQSTLSNRKCQMPFGGPNRLDAINESGDEPIEFGAKFFDGHVNGQQIQSVLAKPFGREDVLKMSGEVFACLKKHGFQGNVSSSHFTKPIGCQSFFTIVEFLVNIIDPQLIASVMGIPKKQKRGANDKLTAEWIIELFSVLAYPQKINKSYLASVSSVHQWPSLLFSVFYLANLASSKQLSSFENLLGTLVKANSNNPSQSVSQIEQNQMIEEVDAAVKQKFDNMNRMKNLYEAAVALRSAERANRERGAHEHNVIEARKIYDDVMKEAFEKEYRIDDSHVAELNRNLEHLSRIKHQKTAKIEHVLQCLNSIDRTLPRTCWLLEQVNRATRKSTAIKKRVLETKYTTDRAMNELKIIDLEATSLLKQFDAKHPGQSTSVAYDLFGRIDQTNRQKEKLLEQIRKLSEDLNNEHLMECSLDVEISPLIDFFNQYIEVIRADDEQIGVHLLTVVGLSSRPGRLLNTHFADPDNVVDFADRYELFSKNGTHTEIVCRIKEDIVKMEIEYDHMSMRITHMESIIEAQQRELDSEKKTLEGLQRMVHERNVLRGEAKSEYERQKREYEQQRYELRMSINKACDERNDLKQKLRSAKSIVKALTQIQSENKHKYENTLIELKRLDSEKANAIREVREIVRTATERVKKKNDEEKRLEGEVQSIQQKITAIAQWLDDDIAHSNQILAIYEDLQIKQQ